MNIENTTGLSKEKFEDLIFRAIKDSQMEWKRSLQYVEPGSTAEREAKRNIEALQKVERQLA